MHGKMIPLGQVLQDNISRTTGKNNTIKIQHAKTISDRVKNMPVVSTRHCKKKAVHVVSSAKMAVHNVGKEIRANQDESLSKGARAKWLLV